MPQLSWRQLRIASAAALAVLLMTAYVARLADAEPDGPPHSRPAVLTPSARMLAST